MGSDDGLLLVGVVEALDVLQVGNIKSCDVVANSEGEVGVLAVVGNVRVDGNGVLGLRAKVVQQLGDTLLAVLVLTEGVDNPDLTVLDSTKGLLDLVRHMERDTYVAIAAPSLLPGINLTSWIPWPWTLLA